MQTFKQIPYQNYIQLKFNTRNIQEAERQEALIKYKRNSQLLAQIFTFHQPTAPQTQPTQSPITQQTFEQLKSQIQSQKQHSAEECERIKKTTQLYEETIKSVNEITSKEQLTNKIEYLKANNLYDHQHPFFAEGSPFYLNTTEDEVLEVPQNQMQDENDDHLNFLELA